MKKLHDYLTAYVFGTSGDFDPDAICPWDVMNAQISDGQKPWGIHWQRQRDWYEDPDIPF